jgi:hypothetical protein
LLPKAAAVHAEPRGLAATQMSELQSSAMDIISMEVPSADLPTRLARVTARRRGDI